MKKSIFAYILGLSVLLVLTAGCGNSESTGKQGGIYGECYPDETCNEGLVCDTDHNTCIKEKGDAEMPAADEDADSTEEPDIQAADEDFGDTEAPDADDDEPEESDIKESGVWQDPKTGLIWSTAHSVEHLPELSDVLVFCDDLVEDGFSDWKLPNIDELRTLVQNCSRMEPYGLCKVSEEAGALSWYDDLDPFICYCEWKEEWTQQVGDEFLLDNGGFYSKLGDDQDVILYSSSRSDYGGDLWCISFNTAVMSICSQKSVNSVLNPEHFASVRCVGSYSRQQPCEGFPDGASWNVYSSIPQTWDGSSWQPGATGVYNETPNDAECRFVCNPGYKWDGSKCSLQNIKDIAGCSHGSPVPCYDSSSGLIWSAKAPEDMLHYDAVDYCDNLVEGGLGGWHLPTISELRTLIQNCVWTVTGGECGITDDCLSAQDCEYSYSQCESACRGTGGSSEIRIIFSKFGDKGDFLSSSKVAGSSATVWGVGFDTAQILSFGTDEVYDKGSVRCVKNVHVPCTGLPENALWNSVSSVWQICGETSCQPSTVGVYNETPSETECRFKCYPGYEWNGSKCTLKTPEALSECSPESPMPCRDSATGLIWSDKPSEMMMLDDAQNYCDNLVEGVIDDWRLPTVGELRTLIVNCPATEPGGVCGVTDECLLIDNCWARTDCKCRYGEAAYSKFHSKFMYELISSASKTGKIISGFENVWCVDFSEAGIKSCSLEYGQTFRCVR